MNRRNYAGRESRGKSDDQTGPNRDTRFVGALGTWVSCADEQERIEELERETERLSAELMGVREQASAERAALRGGNEALANQLADVAKERDTYKVALSTGSVRSGTVGRWDADVGWWLCRCPKTRHRAQSMDACPICHTTRPPAGTCAHGKSMPCAECGCCCGHHDPTVPHRAPVTMAECSVCDQYMGPCDAHTKAKPVAPETGPAPSKHSLTFIINGEETSQPVTPGMPVKAARNRGLEATGNTGRPPDEWEIRDVYGVRVQPDVMAVSFPHETRLFCTIMVGSGGAGARDEQRCHIGVDGCTSVATHDLGPFGGSRRTIPACLFCVRAHDAEGTQYGLARTPRKAPP